MFISSIAVFFTSGFFVANVFAMSYVDIAERLYDPKVESCCGGVFQPISNPNQKCCSNELYDQTTQLCCKDVVRPKDNENSECCATQTFDSSAFTCCWDVVDETERIVPKDGNKFFCCGGENLFDYDTHMCCNGQILPKEESLTCCNDQAINSTVQACCWDDADKAYPLDKMEDGQDCCGTELYNIETHQCCFGNLVQKIEGVEEYHCCGTNSFDPRTHTCCESWNVSDEIEANVFEGSGRSCCGTNVYDNGTEECCDDVVAVRDEGSDFGMTRCCVFTHEPTTSEEE